MRRPLKEFSAGDIAPASGLCTQRAKSTIFVCAFLLPAALCAQAIQYWVIENRLHTFSDTSFREDASRIRCNASIFARLRSFAANIPRSQRTERRSLNL